MGGGGQRLHICQSPQDFKGGKEEKAQKLTLKSYMKKKIKKERKDPTHINREREKGGWHGTPGNNGGGKTKTCAKDYVTMNDATFGFELYYERPSHHSLTITNTR